MELYPTIIKIGHAIIKEAYTSGFIKPGVTTTDDVMWCTWTSALPICVLIPIRIMLEENAFFDGKKVTYMDGRLTNFHLVKS